MSSSSRSSSPVSEASSYASSGLYVPIHRRNRSGSGSSFCTSRSSGGSWRSRSPACSERSVASSTVSSASSQSHIYTPEMLLQLAKSPLAKLSPERRESIREVVPSIVMNRRQRKYKEFFANVAAKKTVPQPTVAPSSSGSKRPAARQNNNNHGRKQTKPNAMTSSAVNGNWRGRRPATAAAASIPVAVAA